MNLFLNDKTLRYILLIIALLWCLQGHSQCTATNPCVQVPITNSNPLPSPAVLWICMGGCSQASLNAAIAQQTPGNLCPAVNSVWRCVQFVQTKLEQRYNDPEPWGALMKYASQGTTAGMINPASPIATCPMPSQARRHQSLACR